MIEYQKTSKIQKNAIFLMGPTAAGKSGLAIELAAHLPVEIISVDSAMVYRGMDIGTGKPSADELLLVPHHLINIRDPSEPYSAAEFASDALELMAEITRRGKIPLLVGGTLLYFRALQEGLSPLPPANPVIRARVLAEANTVGWTAMHQRLAEIDPASAKRIHPNDPQRIQRALEVYEISGKPMSTFFPSPDMGKCRGGALSPPGIRNYEIPNMKNRRGGTLSPPGVDVETPCKMGEYDGTPLSPPGIGEYKIHVFALAPKDRKELHQRIEKRFHAMLEQGLLLEVEKLFKRGDLTPDLPATRAVGYRQVWKYLEGEYNYDEMVYKAIVATRQLAKRQLTWLRSLPEIKWLENNHLASLKTMINSVSK